MWNGSQKGDIVNDGEAVCSFMQEITSTDLPMLINV